MSTDRTTTIRLDKDVNKTTTIRLDNVVEQQVDELMKLWGVNRSEVIRRSVSLAHTLNVMLPKLEKYAPFITETLGDEDVSDE